MTLEGDTGSLSDVGELGDEWAFTLYDIQGEELLCFAFKTEQTARTAHKMMSHVVIEAMAIASTTEYPQMSCGDHAIGSTRGQTGFRRS